MGLPLGLRILPLTVMALAMIGGCMPTPSASSAVITGRITYLERIALPPDAAIEVTLIDISRADAAARVIATQKFSPSGQVPVPFTLTYDPGLIDERSRYSVRAVIYDPGGAMIYTSTTIVPVLTQGAGNEVEIQVQRVQRPR